MMYQCLLARNVDADEAIGVSCFNRGLLCVEYVKDLDIVSSKCEADKVLWSRTGVGVYFDQ